MKPKNEEQPANEWGQLRSFLARVGMSQEQIDEAIGDKKDGRTRAQICDSLRLWLANNQGISGLSKVKLV